MRTIFAFLFLAAVAHADVSVEIDLSAQRAFLKQDEKVVYESPISSGRESHPTPTGRFEVLEKDLDHRSSLYGKIVADDGRVLVRDADSATPVPKGASFVQAPMKFFMRFDGATGMHAGILPGHPASHGCVRMPLSKAKLFYEVVEVGTPVIVHGRAPYAAPVRREKPAAAATPAPTPAPKRDWFPWIQRIRR